MCTCCDDSVWDNTFWAGCVHVVSPNIGPLTTPQGLPTTFDSPVFWGDEELSSLEGSAWQGMAEHVRAQALTQYDALAPRLQDSGCVDRPRLGGASAAAT
jgi:hypothetical protein